MVVVWLRNLGDDFMRFKVVLEPSEEGGYTIYVPSLPGCISEGDTVEQALKNIQEAIELYLEPVEDDWILEENAVVQEIELWARFPACLIHKSSKLYSEMVGQWWGNAVATFGYRKELATKYSRLRFQPIVQLNIQRYPIF